MKRILIVDDFEPGRLVLRKSLEKQGYVCQEAENGLEALQTLRATYFDLVITDNTMPVMTGLEFIQFLAQQPPAQQPPVILLTGTPSRYLYDEARLAGAQGIFNKPYDAQILFSEISSILQSR